MAAIQAKGGDALINTQVQEKWFWNFMSLKFPTSFAGTFATVEQINQALLEFKAGFLDWTWLGRAAVR